MSFSGIITFIFRALSSPSSQAKNNFLCRVHLHRSRAEHLNDSLGGCAAVLFLRWGAIRDVSMDTAINTHTIEKTTLANVFS